MLSAVVAFALAGSIVGCTPQSTPSPAPSSSSSTFSSDAEAFAAAEATYRAYVDATNARRADPTSVPDPNDFLSGQALDDEISTASTLSERGWRITGNTEIASIRYIAKESESHLLQICLDASATRVLDSSGADVTPTNRTTMQSLAVRFAPRTAGVQIIDSVTSTEPC
ncbi:hypothetical protein E5344_08180 [Microbacterium laevaniformans]|uniref:Uncharacterized protein n=1 Tax=Microbacterium laevaniformans TaxID=36807 RepID=A0A4S2D8I6_9MICO|nr:hypothetical protein [Microbacterium laevaniformans]TGY37655.1 hypothetical protein E5344_08180 [Microbacterium laevaniformans]